MKLKDFKDNGWTWTGLPGKNEESIIDCLDHGNIKRAVELLREKAEITSPDLIQRICDHLDPEMPKKRGAPSLDYDREYQERLRLMIECFLIRKAAYRKKGYRQAATLAKGDILDKFHVGSTVFEKAHKKYANTIGSKVLVSMLKCPAFDEDTDEENRLFTKELVVTMPGNKKEFTKQEYLDWAWDIKIT